LLIPILDLIAPRLRKGGRYIEPFTGGGAVFFALAGAGLLNPIAGSLLNDSNADLMNLYRRIRDQPATLMDVITRDIEKYGLGLPGYLSRRDRFNDDGARHLERAALFLILNKTCYNGLWRVNKAGKFNVSFDGSKSRERRDRSIFDAAHMDALSRALSNAHLFSVDFVAIAERAESGDVVYFDPPYLPASMSADFTAYTANGFGVSDHLILLECVVKLAKRGVHCILSEGDSPALSDVIKAWQGGGWPTLTLQPVEARRSINSVGDRRGLVREWLIYNTNA